MSTPDDLEHMRATLRDVINALTFSEISPDQPLLSSRLLDSIGAVDLLVEIEKRYHVRVPLKDVNEIEFDTLDQIVAKVHGMSSADRA